MPQAKRSRARRTTSPSPPYIPGSPHTKRSENGASHRPRAPSPAPCAAPRRGGGSRRTRPPKPRLPAMPKTFSSFSLPLPVNLCRYYACPTRLDRLPIQLRVISGEFLDRNELILADIGEVLSCLRRRPPGVDRQNARAVPEADMLLQRVSAKRARFP